MGLCSNALGKLPFGAEQSASETDLPELVLCAGVAVPILYLTQPFKPAAGVHSSIDASARPPAQPGGTRQTIR